jgi:hypothetical protein
MMSDLQALLSRPPASFAWSQSEDGVRTIGTCPGCGVDIWPDRVSVAALMPNDDAALVERNSVLLLLILTALRPDWATAGDWLTTQMGMAARNKRDVYEGTNYSRRVVFGWSKRTGTATLKVKRDGRDDSRGA